ncbi:MAG: hypothetical protein A3G81_20310 [Betaproteobacteria bacterium RIFCSPLOWO2_12_FULL_65_14]|nr:MAG: hypothetical protein A3G81_20310 [Betaproteobacteria bacterium RIFCSPLOWO2_12_FULL_65_14]
MRAKVDRGLIAGGEIGELTPVARVSRVGAGYAVEMHSGLMRLIYSAARAIVATDSGRFSGHANPALSAAEAASKVAELFKSYREQKIATAQKFPATAGQQKWAHAIAVHAETFLLMHELAHIHNEHSFWLWRPFRRQRDVLGLETDADATAGKWLIDYVLNPKPGSSQPQMFYAGAEFGLRVRMAMETVGMLFEPTHPKAGDRIAGLRAALRARAGSRAFYAIANTSIAFDQMWRATEQLLLGRAPAFELTLDDILASMRTLVVELLADSDINDLVSVSPVAGQPGQMQVMFAPKEPRKIALFDVARDTMRHASQKVRDAARAQAGNVFEEGTVQYSLLLALLTL